MTATLFAIRLDSDDRDDVIKVLDCVADAGVSDDEWEWLSWVTPRGRTYCVVRGSMRSRGAFVDAPRVKSVMLSTVLHQAEDSRCRWIEPKEASSGRERLEQWVADPEVATVTEIVLPTKAPTEVASSGTVRVRRPDAAPPASRNTEEDRAPERGSARHGGDEGGRAGGYRGPRTGDRPPVRTTTSRQVNPVLSAFGFGKGDESDKPSLYAASEDDR